MQDFNSDSTQARHSETSSASQAHSEAHDEAGLPSPDALSDLELQIALLGEEKAKLEAEKQDLMRLAQSRQAEFENFRRRVERERLDTVELAAADTVKSLLPIVDDFARAVAVQTTDSNYAKGVELIHQRLQEILAKLGLEALDSSGQSFDPNLHYAIDKVESPDSEEGLILEEFQKGYRFRGKLLRPAMVKVAAKP
jgi:molecular chaperone GrpE